MTAPYTQRLPALELEIKRATPDVPDDGKYYVLAKGQILGAFPSLKRAQERYKKYVEESGYQPPAKPKLTAEELVRREDLHRDIDRTAAYWADAHKFRRGGKLRHR